MNKNKMDLAQILREEVNISHKKQMRIVLQLSIPAIMAQMVSILMQYIDAAMVGSLGEEASAAIGLVASTTWLIGGLSSSLSAGFSVQVAQYIGAGEQEQARRVVKQAYIIDACFSLCLMGIAMLIAKPLPVWLGGDESIQAAAQTYFFIYACALPMHQMNSLSASMLQCSGNMKVPSILEGCMCILDILFNALFIFPERNATIGGISIVIPGFGLGVAGAALGTTLSFVVIGLILMFMVCVKSPVLHFRREESWKFDKNVLKKALHIALPMAFEHTALCGAQVVSTKIVAPLGNVAIAANSFAVTAESLCYMPGYGFSAAATTLVGQSMGAGRIDMAKKFAKLAVMFGMAVMAVTGILMYIAAPFVFSLLTPVQAVRELGVHVLRIEVFAEPLFAASIVATGALRGAGDTLVPGIMNLISIWGMRITLSLLWVGSYGLTGVWVAMCVELCFRGIIFLIRLGKGKWWSNSLLSLEQ